MALNFGNFAGFFSKAFQGTSPIANQEIAATKQVIRQFEDLFGIKVQQDKDGQILILPEDAFDSRGQLAALSKAVGGGQQGFGDYWIKSAYVSPNEAYVIEQERRARYTHYAFMDINSPIAALTLDTYADEAISTSTIDSSPLDIKISDKELERKIIGILKDNQLISSSDKPAFERAELRELAKFGDRFYKVNQYEAGGDIRVIKVRCPELVNIVWDPKNPSKILEYGSQGNTRYFPWEFSHFCIPDNKYMPYGRSVMEPMRAAYQQLLINEALMAISRSSKIDRLVFKVPVPTKNAVAAFTQIQSLRKILKSTVFGEGVGATSRSKIDSFTDIVMMPSGEEYSIDRLSSSIAIADIEDVNYFRDAFITGTRLPKSYLLADDTYKVDAGTLQAQDVKFARALMPLQYGYVEGLTRLCVSLVILLNGDPEQVKVSISVKKPQAFNSQIIKDASESVNFIDELLTVYAKAIGAGDQSKRNREKVKETFTTLSGLPKEVIGILDGCFENIVPPAPDTGQPGLTGPGDQAMLPAPTNPDAPVDLDAISRNLLTDRITCTSGMILTQMTLGADKETAIKQIKESVSSTPSSGRKTKQLVGVFEAQEASYIQEQYNR